MQSNKTKLEIEMTGTLAAWALQDETLDPDARLKMQAVLDDCMRELRLHAEHEAGVAAHNTTVTVMSDKIIPIRKKK